MASWQEIASGQSSWDNNNQAVKTSVSTDAGKTWNVQGYLPLPSNSTLTAGVSNDARLAYRLNSGKPQLLCAYDAWDDNTIQDCAEGGGICVAFSTNDGKDWGTTPTIVEAKIDQNNTYIGCMTIRPELATDKTTGLTTSGNAYVCWTRTPCITRGCFGDISEVRTATILSGSTVATNYNTIKSLTSTTDYVEACDIGVASNGYVLVLWEERHTGLETRDLYISESTDGGQTFPNAQTYTVATGIPAPDASASYDDFVGNPDNIEPRAYQDYPSMTISKSSGGSEVVYVAYTAGTSSPSTNPSDLFVKWCSTSALNSWNTTNIVQVPDNGIDPYPGGSSSYTIQFEPTLAPDGTGGVFLLYYTQQISGNEVPAMYELQGSDASSQGLLAQQPISLPFPSFTETESKDGTGVGDYIGIAYDPVLRLAHPIWTDFNSTDNVLDVYTISIGAEPLVGDLGFSNQRRVVMTSGEAHLAGYGQLVPPDPNAPKNKKHTIWYSEQPEQQNGWAQEWSVPLELDLHDFDNYNGQSTAFSDGVIIGNRTPSIGVYQRSNTGQRAVAEVWAARPPSPLGYSYELEVIYIRVKEWTTTENGDLSDWSPVDSIFVRTGATAPVVAPLTAQVGTSLTDRYLIGWVITYAGSGNLNSVTLLRGTQTGENVKVMNESWGTYTDTWTAPSMLVYDGFLRRLCDGLGGLTHGSFVSVTSDESNGNGIPGGPLGDITPAGTGTQTIVFTGEGDLPYSNVWAVNATYSTVPGSLLGEPMPGGVTTPFQLDAGDPTMPAITYNPNGTIKLPPTFGFERNPSVTITSTGQKIAAWEEMDGSWTGYYPVYKYYSHIELAKTIPGALSPWNPVLEKITETANDDSWSWLRNPSVTAFPKTSLKDATDNSDQDPGAAELLYVDSCAQNALGATTTYNYVLEEQFHELQGDLHTPTFGGKWYLPKPSWFPTDPTNNNNYIGANAQRSFGIYNTGPQYGTTQPLGSNDLLNPDGSTSYTHGLSYGVANAVAGGTIEPWLSSPTPDIGALKGTYDTALGVQLYRSEQRRKDSSVVTFKWGKVYVGDTALNEPFREVMLHDGEPDSNGYISHDAIRDSIFATEWFDWPVSAEVKYDRLMLIPQAGVLTYRIDTLTDYDTLGNPIVKYDTVAGSFIPDTTRRTDSAFFETGTGMVYTVQLVHISGHVDTIEQAVYIPSLGLFITPKTVHIENASNFADTVMLRVVGSFTNVPDADSDVRFEEETMLDTYPSIGDTTFAIVSGGGQLPLLDPSFSAMGPYSNPSHPSAKNVSILVHYPSSGSTITAQVYDQLGNAVGAASSYTSDGQKWDRIPIHAPATAGGYYITVSVGNYLNSLGYIVQ